MKFGIKYFFSVAALSVFAASHAQSVFEITPLSGEKWWGVFAADSPSQPFDAPFATDTAPCGNAFRTGRLVSSSGRFINIAEPASVAFDGDKFVISSAGGQTGAVKGGRTLRQAYLAMHHRDFRASEGFPPPEFFSGLVYETAADLGFLQTAAGVTAYARRLLDEGFPPGIMVLDEGWRGASGYGFDPCGYPDPAAFIGEMHSMGFKVMLTVTPYVHAWGREFAELCRDGKLVTDSAGIPLVMSGPGGVFAALDLTCPPCADALKESLAGLQVKYGVDGFRFDCSRLITEVGVDFAKVYLQAVRNAGAEFVLAEFVPGLPEFRPDCASAIRTAKDTEAGYAADLINSGIAAGPFTQVLPGAGLSEGGSEKGRVRYALMMAMTPVARVPFAPWKYDFAAEEMKRALDFRASISKYMSGMYGEACKTMEPIIRPMEYNFPNCGFADCAGQYMLGDKYLIAPALDDSPRRLVRLPKGTWRDMNGRKHKGPLVIEAETDGYRMAWFELL